MTTIPVITAAQSADLVEIEEETRQMLVSMVRGDGPCYGIVNNYDGTVSEIMIDWTCGPDPIAEIQTGRYADDYVLTYESLEDTFLVSRKVRK